MVIGQLPVYFSKHLISTYYVQGKMNKTKCQLSVSLWLMRVKGRHVHSSGQPQTCAEPRNEQCARDWEVRHRFFLRQRWVGRAQWEAHLCLSLAGPSLSLIGPLLHDKPQDINHFFEKTSGPHLGKLGLEQQRPCWKVVHQRQNF